MRKPRRNLIVHAISMKDAKVGAEVSRIMQQDRPNLRALIAATSKNHSTLDVLIGQLTGDQVSVVASMFNAASECSLAGDLGTANHISWLAGMLSKNDVSEYARFQLVDAVYEIFIDDIKRGLL